MAEIKNSYEFMLIVSTKVGEKTKELVEKFENLVSEKAQLSKIDRMGKRRLAYPIRKELEGEYVVFYFDSDPEFPQELDRICQITDGVLRSLIIKKHNN